jgi:two-component system OmpR family response regulator
MRILVVEDDEKIASFIVNGLKQSGFAVDTAGDGEDALSLCAVVSYDAIVLDIMLPKLDGLSVIRRLRHDRSMVPVLLLSARASVENRVVGLQAGADDYLTKPFSFSELLARVQALIRRASHVAEPTTLVVGDLSMNLLTREVSRSGTGYRVAKPRIRAARVAHASSGTPGHQDHDIGARLGLQF